MQILWDRFFKKSKCRSRRHGSRYNRRAKSSGNRGPQHTDDTSLLRRRLAPSNRNLVEKRGAFAIVKPALRARIRQHASRKVSLTEQSRCLHVSRFQRCWQTGRVVDDPAGHRTGLER